MSTKKLESLGKPQNRPRPAFQDPRDQSGPAERSRLPPALQGIPRAGNRARNPSPEGWPERFRPASEGHRPNRGAMSMSAPKKSAPAVTGAPKQAVPTPQVVAGPCCVYRTTDAAVRQTLQRALPQSRPARCSEALCLECMGSSLEFGREDAAVRDCPCGEMCSLYPYRFWQEPAPLSGISANGRKGRSKASNRSGTRPNAAGGP